MKDVSLGLDDVTLKIKELGNEDLALVVQVFSDRYINLDSLLKVFQRVWVKKGRIELKVLDHIAFLFYFEEFNDLDFILQRAQWNFNNSLIVVSKIEPGICFYP